LQPIPSAQAAQWEHILLRSSFPVVSWLPATMTDTLLLLNPQSKSPNEMLQDVARDVPSLPGSQRNARMALRNLFRSVLSANELSRPGWQHAVPCVLPDTECHQICLTLGHCSSGC
jgi:hypothetical protein